MGFQHMTPEQRLELSRRAGRLGGQARAKTFTAESQAAAGRAGTRAQKQAAGRQGWAATVARYGADWASKQLADWRRANPNEYELKVMGWLDTFQLVYTHETLVGDVWADFKLADLPAVIEVDGTVWHTNDALHGQDRVGRDAYKNQVYARHHLAVIRLNTDDIKSGAALAQLDLALTALALAPRS